MNINNIKIDNGHAPGEEWWKLVKSKPDQALIEATITMTLSWDEYRKLLGRDESGGIPIEE